MSQVVESSNYNEIISEHEYPSEYTEILKGDETQANINYTLAYTKTRSFYIRRRMNTEAIYVDKIDDGQENLVYNSNMMENDKKYLITWYGEHYMFVKKHDKIEFYKFYPNEVGN